MTHLFRSVLILFFLFGLSACSRKSKKWEKFTYNEGRFSIIMPAPVERAFKKEATVFGYQVNHYFTWKPSSFAMDKFKMFQVSFIECPRKYTTADRIEEALDSSIYERVKDFTDEEIDIHAIELNGYPARAFIYNSSSSIAIVKQCIVANRRYDVTVIAKKNYATNSEVADFYNSFKVNN